MDKRRDVNNQGYSSAPWTVTQLPIHNWNTERLHRIRMRTRFAGAHSIISVSMPINRRRMPMRQSATSNRLADDGCDPGRLLWRHAHSNADAYSDRHSAAHSNAKVPTDRKASPTVAPRPRPSPGKK